jgi:peptide/nickel transport system ATP-binding protein
MIFKRKNVNYISGKESHDISKRNRRITKNLEKYRNRAAKDTSEFMTKMKDDNNVVELDNVCTYFFTDIGVVRAVDGVSFNIPKCSTVGVVGESGCGKSVTSLSIMQLVQRPTGQVVGGEIRLNNDDGTAYNIVNTPTETMQDIRGNKVSMIFQEPMTSLNPVFRIGAQINEVIELHNKEMTPEEVRDRTIEMLKIVGIANAEGIYNMYPHELSGGMRQRVMIAIALACNPRLIIADEPTTALDVTIQAQILDLLRNLKDKINSSIMLITHDLGVIAEMADYVVVMYAGRVVEKGTADDIFHHPCHPYTIGLMKSKPVVGKKVDELYNIPGNVPNPVNMPNYCYFRDRCEFCDHERCSGEYPPEIKISDTHVVSCYRFIDQGEIMGYPQIIDTDRFLNMNFSKQGSDPAAAEKAGTEVLK